MNPYEAMGAPYGNMSLIKYTSENIPHAACSVPCAFVKAMEVAAGLGPRRDVHMTITDA